MRFQNNKPVLPLDDSSPCIVHDPNKCILCGDCEGHARKYRAPGHNRLCQQRKQDARQHSLRPSSFGDRLRGLRSVPCGMPYRRYHGKSEYPSCMGSLADRNTKVVVQIAPAVRGRHRR